MFKIPKVTCIIPTFNRAIYLKQAIDSVLAQDSGRFELIVVDDGSTDDTASIAKGYGTKLHYVFQHNKGASAARNLGLEMAQGEYIAYLDSDDLWELRKLSIQTRFLDQNPDFPLCYTQETWYRNGIRVNPGYKHRKYSGHIFTKCLPLCIISPSSAMIRRKVLEELGGFDEDLPAAEDYDLWLRITSTHPVYFIPIPLIIKRGGHPDQLSRKVANLDKYRIHALVKILSSRILLPENRQAAWQELSSKCRVYGNGCNKHGRSVEADYYINLPLKIQSGLKEGNESGMNINSQMQKKLINPDKLFHLKSIDLSRIDMDDKRFCFRFFQRPSNILVESVRKYGIVYAPILCLMDDKYKVLDGSRRLDAARICNVKKVLCKVCEGSIKECELAWFILSLFLSDGPPNILDQGVILSRFCKLFSQDRVINDILPLLGHPPKQKVMARLLPLSRMEEALGKALLDGRINQDMGLRLMEMESDTRDHISSLFLYFGFSQSKQFEILEYLIDISARENRSLTEILQELGWSGNRQKSAEENKVKAGEAFRRRLKERRNPTISGLEKEWKNKIASLHLPPSISLNPPPYFEGSTYRLSFTFNDLMDLQKKMEGLKDLFKKDEWQKIFQK